MADTPGNAEIIAEFRANDGKVGGPLPLSVFELYSCGVPLRGMGSSLAASGPAWAGSYGCSAGAG